MFGHFPRPHPGAAGLPPPVPARVTTSPGHWRSVLARAGRACCCTAPPAVVAIVPPASGRPPETDLLLCRHHYRACGETLAAIGAVIFDPDDAPEAPERPGEAEPMPAG